ncbi:MAG: hypothetical protein GC155_11805 [Alphaproteobacteria bacterium]|nr:hypothetical protein [Alphaproteobacteria bacterium]
MHVVVNLLLWLHLVGVAMGVGGGIALSQTGPRLIAAAPENRADLWPLEKFFSRIGALGVAILLVTGPLMVWLKFGGVAGFNIWFWLKMGLVVVAVIGIGIHDMARARFERGENGAIPFMYLGGRLAGASMLLVMVCAVFAFN